MREKIHAAKAGDIANKMKEVLQISKQNMAKAQEAMCVQANKKRRVMDIHEGDFVILDGKGLETERPCKKLDNVRHGPYKVKKALGTSYQLGLPASARIHDTFSPNRLTMRSPSLPPLPRQINPPPPPVVITDEPEYEVDDVLDSRYHYKRLQYKVKWTGHEKDNNWYYADDDEFENSADVINRRYPKRAGPE